MIIEKCYWLLCFSPLDISPSTKIFGFAEFIMALTLMLIVWMLSDVRYRFRIAVAPSRWSMNKVTFYLMLTIGILALMTEVWRAEVWWLPHTVVISYSIWQMILSLLFFGNFLTWMWYAFIRPPVYGKKNAKRYAQTLYRYILNGSSADLPVIADELSHSAKMLIRYAVNNEDKFRNDAKGDSEKEIKIPEVNEFADDILLLIANKKFCRHIIESSPVTALALFQEIGATKKYRVPIEIFAKNITIEALRNKDSFLFHESDGYYSGLLGYYKPLSQAMYANYRMVEDIGTLLDPDFSESKEWDASQWEAYCRIVLMTFRSYVMDGYGQHSFVIYRAKSKIEHSVFDLYKLNGITDGSWNNNTYQRLRVVVQFIKDAIEILNSQGTPKYLQLRIRDSQSVGSIYDNIAEIIFEVIFAVSAVREPSEHCYEMQHNSVWIELFNFDRNDGAAAKIIHFKVRRLLYNEIADMLRFPNFKGAKILAFILNVMGFEFRKEKYFRVGNALHKAVLSWTKKNYAWLHSYNPRIAEACLVDGISYDQQNQRLVKTYPAKGLRREPAYTYLELNPISSDSIVGWVAAFGNPTK
ncbi:MAG: hypothetical protein RLZ75_2943 [Pseudomonadota bacterium]|jgi:hypothetical protein